MTPAIGVRRPIITAAAVGLLLPLLAPQAAQAAATSPACGAVISHSVRLTADLSCSGDGLLIDGSRNITLDLAGHSVTAAGVAIRVDSGDQATVKNGRASSLAIASHTHLRDLRVGTLDFRAPVTARRITVTGDSSGLGHSGSDFSDSRLGQLTLTGVTSSRFVGSRIGALGLKDSHSTTIRDDVVDSILVFQTDHAVLRGNTVGRITTNQSRDPRIVDNRVSAPRGSTGTGAGITVRQVDSGGATISGNVVKGFATGISLERYLVGTFTVSRNTARSNSTAGLSADLSQGTASLSLTRNTFRANGASGTATDASGASINDGAHIYLAPTDGSTASRVRLAGNTANGNAGYGIEVVAPAGAVHNGGGNTAHHNGAGGCTGLTCG